MCNIAGYSGSKQAAPILLEMLRQQQAFDGGMATGICTIHDGKLHCRKIIGDVDKLIRETDALDLPGTIGIAHSRPAGNYAPHPALSPDEATALVTNGTTPLTKYSPLWSEAADILDAAGYEFNMFDAVPHQLHPRRTRDDQFVFVCECRVFLIDHYMKQGKSIAEALALACQHMYSDNVTVTVNRNYPDSIFALRTNRPMQAILENGELYMATTRFAFPETLKNEPEMLPLHQTCILRKDGITVTEHKINLEPVAEMTPYTYQEGYRQMEKLLTSGTPMYFDELEIAIDKMRYLWPGDHTYVQHARLVYDLLWQFHQEGRLRKEERIKTRRDGVLKRWYFWLDK